MIVFHQKHIAFIFSKFSEAPPKVHFPIPIIKHFKTSVREFILGFQTFLLMNFYIVVEFL